MTWVDILSFVILIITGIWGFKRGFLLEVADVLSIILAFLFTYFSPLRVGKYLIFSYLISFIIYLVILHFIFLILSRFVKKTPFVIIDRGLGMIVGFLKGFMFIFFIIFLVSLIPKIDKKYPPVGSSYIYKITKDVKPLILFYFHYGRKERRI